jgi:uncharacterized membrane protein (UPF0127 family)
MKSVLIFCPQKLLSKAIKAKYCKSFWCKLRGLMFTKTINPYSGLLLVEENESKINSAIHMLFMNYDIAVFWLNKAYRIVDKKIAKRWKPVIIPNSPASFTLELHPDRFGDFEINDQLVIENE